MPVPRVAAIMPLVEVERSAETIEAFGIAKLTNAGGIPGAAHVAFEDRQLRATFTLLTSEIRVSIENLSPQTLRLPWSEVTFVAHDGSASSVMHGGRAYSGCEDPHPTVVIPKGSSISDRIIPCSRIWFAGTTAGWQETPLLRGFQATYYSSSKLDSLARAMLDQFRGKTLSLLIPIQAGGAVHEYFFRFAVDTVVVVQPVSPASSVAQRP